MGTPEHLRVAIIGHGHMGRLHARHFAPLVELVIVDPAEGHHGDLSAIDAAVIAVPTPAHVEVALPLLQREVPCLIEKPIAADLASARALAAFPHAWVGHIERFNPAIRPLQGLGVRFLQAERVSRWSPRGTDVDVVLDLMIHDIDLFHVLTGDPVVEVRSNGSAIATRGLDIAQARVETASGIVGTFTASRLSRQASRRLRLFVGGEPGEYWSVDLKERQVARLRWGDGELIEERVPVPEQDALAAQARAFLACAFGERPTDGIAPATAGEGLRALELALRIRDSAHS